MNKKSNAEKTFDFNGEEISEKKGDRLSSLDSAQKRFIKEPTESDLYDTFKLKPYEFFLLTILDLIIFFSSIASADNGGMEIYVAVPIAILSCLGFLILIKCAKQHDEENKKNHK